MIMQLLFTNMQQARPNGERRGWGAVTKESLRYGWTGGRGAFLFRFKT